MSLLSRDRPQLASADHSTGHHSSSRSELTPATTPSLHESGQLSTATPPFLALSDPQATAITIIPGYHMPLDEVDQILRQYSAEMVPQFPFVPLPEGSSRELCGNHPLLLRTVLWACRPTGSDFLTAFELWFREQLAVRTVVRMEKNLEILQALLVFLAWYGFSSS